MLSRTHKFSTCHVQIDENISVPGMKSLPVLETSNVKRADVNGYKSISNQATATYRGALIFYGGHFLQDYLWGCRHMPHLQSFNSVTVFFPEFDVSTCVGKITVDFGPPQFKFTYVQAEMAAIYLCME